MADKLTPQQEMAVYNQGGNLLVSAAAGSGKTKVLVDRLLRYILDPNDPAQIDEFLIITFTKAAASELRGKIAAKLTEKMAELPENRHLQKQMQRLYLAKITTVDAFCAELLREFAYLLDIPADFRVIDENEAAQLRQTAMDRLLESIYDTAQENEELRSFVDAQGLGRDDKLVPQIVSMVYDSAQRNLDPEAWLQKCVDDACVEGLDDAAQTIWGQYLMEDLKSYLDLQIATMEGCAKLAAEADGLDGPAALFSDTVLRLQHLRDSRTWDEVLERKNIDFATLLFPRKFEDVQLRERLKLVRKTAIADIRKRLGRFTDPSSVILEDLSQTAMSVRGLVYLVRQFAQEYKRLKKARRAMDFTDLSHSTLDLLCGRHRTGPTAAARQISDRFREIMVDEYQDTNALQDTIYSTLSHGKNNCFMVGDVKQSIYRFRLADPKIFIEKYHTYDPAELAKPGQGRKVMLSANFRSGGDVLKSVNSVFELCMSRQVGGLDYGEAEALKEGIPHTPLGEPEVELALVEVQESTYDEEAAWIAQRICELTDGTHFVRDGAHLRPIQLEDIAILQRSPKTTGSYLRRALDRRGIRYVTSSGENLLQTQEVATLRAILQTVSNPRQDIPLITALASPVFGFTADDLAAFRSADRYSSVYDALLKWDTPKARQFVHILEQLRLQARVGTLAQLIEKIYQLTAMDSIYAAMDAGESRLEHLQNFYSIAVNFEQAARRDLEQFLEHLQSLGNDGLVVSSEQKTAGAVIITSMHKSKGLEYPVVFVCGLSKEFNREFLREQAHQDPQLGIGLTVVDPKLRVRYPTVAKRAIALKTLMDNASEEMRILYVALTRARDRLIMTYATQKPEKAIQDLAQRMDVCPTQLLAGEAICLGHWVLMTALRRTEAGALFALGGRPERTHLGDPVWNIQVVKAPEVTAAAATSEEETELPREHLELLHRFKDYSYSFKAATKAPSKQTATQRKGRQKDEEAAQDTQLPQCSNTLRKPGQSIARGKDYGNAVHGVMQHIRFENCESAQSIVQELLRLQESGYLTAQQTEAVRVNQLLAFFKSALGQKLRSGVHVLREFKFSILDDGQNYGEGLENEKILLQGVVDCALLEEDGITVIDFKTDYVTEDTVDARAEHYCPQVQTYAHAMSRVYEMPVKAAYLYFFSLNRFIKV